MRIVLLHGLPLDARMWERQTRTLAGRDLLAPTLYGLGPSVDAWAEAVLRRAAGSELVLVGASMGGYGALAAAVLAPERVRGIVLVGSRADADSPERRAGRAATIAKVRKDGLESFWDETVSAWFGEATPPGVRERARALAVEQDRELVASALEAIRDRADSTAVVAGFPGPLLVCAGDRDPLVTPEEAERLAASAPRGRLELFEGAGHFVSLERPDRFDETLTAFLSAVEA